MSFKLNDIEDDIEDDELIIQITMVNEYRSSLGLPAITIQELAVVIVALIESADLHGFHPTP